MKITGINNLNQTHLYTTTITYPRTVEIYQGHYPEKHILHNLKIKIDEYLKTKLDKNQTNVYGKKTDFFAFNEEENYVLFLRYMIDKIVNSLEGHIFNHFDTKFEVQAWANVLEKDDYVQNHNHTCYHSILYLSEGADLVLPELGLSLSPRCGDWYLLPPYVLHYCNKYNKEQKRYSLISNFVDKNDWQELKNKKIIT
tara:strand:- start:3480 stop:4073 length:594 start_codon:yes stop_codon:yes gene_type:complete